jgi:hypothetical protein
MLRIRYRRGVAVDPHGFPDWIPYARALVELPPLVPGVGVDEARVADVVTANAAAASSGDPLWTMADPAVTPHGWVWAQLAMTRRTALVPVELHGAYRHLGGVSTGNADRGRRGLPGLTDPGAPPGIRFDERLSDEVIGQAEQRLGYELPIGYRDFLARSNGGRPSHPAVHPGFGFIVDRPLFGLARAEWLDDLLYANAFFGDRFTADWLAIGYVQGGLIALSVGHGVDRGSVWYWDDDDPRDHDEYSATDVCGRLLHRCADDFGQFWRALREVPGSLRLAARSDAERGLATLVEDDRLGRDLPVSRRRPGRLG